MEAKVSEKKKQEVEQLTQLLKTEKIIGIIDLTNLPSAQFQKIKHKLKKDLRVRVSKKSLIKLAIEKAKDSRKNLEKLEEYLQNCMPALLFTNEDAFKVAKLLSKNKSSSPAKPGQIAPKDIVVEEGPTPFSPGPIIGELGAAGIKAAIEDGKVVIKQAATIVKKGEEITQSQADMLAKFGIEPMEIGLNIVAVYQDGDIFDAEVLSIDESEYIEMIKTAAAEALNLAVYSAYPTKETVELLLQKAERESLALDSKIPEQPEEKQEEKTEEPTEEPKQEEQKDENPQKDTQQDSQTESTETTQTTTPDGYTEQAEEQAQEFINKLKDDNIGG